MRNITQNQRNGTAVGAAGHPNRLGVLALFLLILAAILALLFMSPREAARVVRGA
ncbi:MAG: hypothetical protein QUS11_09035 [Candidatus Fermentibacter sp.]|nr:hypothetical protein [Candidatus Fermentibacter sp.]